MAERPALYRIFRLGDAVTLGPGRGGAQPPAPRRRREPRSGTARTPRRPARRWPSSARTAPGFCGSGARSYRPPGARPGRRRTVRGRDLRRRSDPDPQPLQPRARSARSPRRTPEALAISRSWLAYLTVDGEALPARARRMQQPRQSREGEGDRLRVAAGPDRAPEPRRRPRLLRGLAGAAETRSSGAT